MVRGQNVVEYGLLIATVALIVLLCAEGLGGIVNAWLHVLVQHVIGS